MNNLMSDLIICLKVITFERGNRFKLYVLVKDLIGLTEITSETEMGNVLNKIEWKICMTCHMEILWYKWI